MRSCRRIVLLFLLVLICLFQLIVPASAESVRNKKIVSIVYDDSGSMHSDEQLKWTYANYAMQSFAGMLNKEDILLINYMSSVENGNQKSNLIDTVNRNGSVMSIRTHSASGNTPFDAIEVAYNNLKANQDGNSNTQYWLVVMTDGEFNNTEITTVENKLCSIADDKMPNGTSPKIIYLSICDANGNFTPKDGLRNNISVKKADKADDITQAISEISDEISGRYSVSEKDIEFIDETTVKVSSKIPLINIGVLTQYSQAKVQNVALDDKNLTVEGNVEIKYPEVTGRKTDTSLLGNVALINNNRNNIPPGTYTLKFSNPVSKENVDIMFEPAIELRLTLYADGKKIDDVSRIKSQMVLEAEANLYELGTDNIIDLSLLPDGISHSVKHVEDGNEVASTDQLKLSNISLSPIKTIIEATLNLPGYFTLYDSHEFTPANFVLTGIKSEISYDGSERRTHKDKETGEMIKDAENVVYISDLEANRTGVKFMLELNGAQIDKQTAEELLPEFKKSITSKLGPCGIEISDDGDYLVYPTQKPWWKPSVIYWINNHGNQQITVNMDGVEAQGTLDIKLGDPICLLDIWPWLLIIYFTIWLLFKPRFKKGRIIGYMGRLDEYGELIYDINPSINERIGWGTDMLHRWLWIGPAKKKIGGYTFQGGSNFFIREDRNYIVGVKGKYSDSSKRPTNKLKDNKTRIRSEKVIGDGFTYIHFYRKKI